ncbi:hypothetical protein C0J52_02691 [Blattella germanica]|nr:hypothetical protein C0J52_02691 [Blattella germanica]
MSTSESEAEDLIFDDSTDTPSEDDLDDELSFEEPCSSKQSRRAGKVVQNDTLFVLDEFVIVNYEGTLFPGVTGINPKNQEVKVSCMQRGLKGSWKWPKEKDELFYGVKDVIEKIDKSCVSKVKGVVYCIKNYVLRNHWLDY